MRCIWVLIVLSLLPALGCAAAPSGESGLAKIGPELRSLYEEYREARASGRPLIVTDPTIRVAHSRVLIEATASGSVDALKSDLVALGLRNAAAAGRLVSGTLPIEQIPAMAGLASLRFARAARPMTHGPGGPGVR